MQALQLWCSASAERTSKPSIQASARSLWGPHSTTKWGPHTPHAKNKQVTRVSEAARSPILCVTTACVSGGALGNLGQVHYYFMLLCCARELRLLMQCSAACLIPPLKSPASLAPLSRLAYLLPRSRRVCLECFQACIAAAVFLESLIVISSPKQFSFFSDSEKLYL